MGTTVTTDLTVPSQLFYDKVLAELQPVMPLGRNMSIGTFNMKGKPGDTAYFVKADNTAMASTYTEGETIALTALGSATVSKQAGTLVHGVGVSYQAREDTIEMLKAENMMVAAAMGQAFGRRIENDAMVAAQNGALHMIEKDGPLSVKHILEGLTLAGTSELEGVGNGMVITSSQGRLDMMTENDGFLFGNAVTGLPRFAADSVGMIGNFNVYSSPFTRCNKTHTIIPAESGASTVHCHTGRGLVANDKAVISWFDSGEKKTQVVEVYAVSNDKITLKSALTDDVPTGALVEFALDEGSTDPLGFTDTLIICPGAMGWAMKREINVKTMDRPDKQQFEYYGTTRYAVTPIFKNRIILIRNRYATS